MPDKNVIYVSIVGNPYRKIKKRNKKKYHLRCGWFEGNRMDGMHWDGWASPDRFLTKNEMKYLSSSYICQTHIFGECFYFQVEPLSVGVIKGVILALTHLAERYRLVWSLSMRNK